MSILKRTGNAISATDLGLTIYLRSFLRVPGCTYQNCSSQTSLMMTNWNIPLGYSLYSCLSLLWSSWCLLLNISHIAGPTTNINIVFFQCIVVFLSHGFGWYVLPSGTFPLIPHARQLAEAIYFLKPDQHLWHCHCQPISQLYLENPILCSSGITALYSLKQQHHKSSADIVSAVSVMSALLRGRTKGWASFNKVNSQVNVVSGATIPEIKPHTFNQFFKILLHWNTLNVPRLLVFVSLKICSISKWKQLSC